MSESDHHGTCHDCEREMHRRNLQMVPVHITNPDGGYERVPMPVCPDCRGRRFGYDCPNCGLTHDDKESAQYCCQRAPGDAPDCRECGRRMEKTAFGFTADGRPTCEFAQCEACDIGWGKYTGWHYPDDEE
ncbi:hypothetical protein [Halomontanus rarus]|uniref:hypothetical protein n=1 Tax=Halomontanus rarus TaxID=3034020 RepID=UPI0023E7CCE1|nr:hypothetical protein [Halovivax sp. TS33]